MGKRFQYFLAKAFLVPAFLLIAMPVGAALPEDAPSLPVTGGSIIRNDARVTFEWPQPVKFHASAHGKTVTITFERNANPDFGPLLSSLYPYVKHAKLESDGKTIVLTLDKPYRIRTFISDNVGGVDLLNIDPKARQGLDEAAGENPLSVLAPAAGGEAPAPAAAPAAGGDDGAAMPLAEAEKKAEEAAKNAPLKLNVSAAEDSAVLRLPFTERTAIAVFTRPGVLWIVFNKSTDLDLADFDGLPKTVIHKGEAFQDKDATILRLPIDDGVFAAVAKEENSFAWAILLTSKKQPPPNPLKIEINADPPTPYVLVDALEMASPVTVQDPIIGDDLIITPLYNPGEGVPVMRDFVEFTVMASTQGIVVAKKADEVAVSEQRNGLRISTPQGAIITPGLPEDVQKVQTEALQSVATLFPYDSWKLDAGVPRRSMIRYLFHRIVESDNLQDANDARLRLAQLYLSEGLAPEALGLLDGINRTNPVFYRSAKLAAMHGAANFLIYRFNDSMRDFAASELNNNKEMDYWRNMFSDLNGTPGQYDYLAMNQDYISKYPPLFRQRLAIVAADHSIGAKEYNTAIKIFDTLRGDKDDKNQDKAKLDALIAPITPYVNYLMAKIASDTGQEQEAIDMWDKLATDLNHPFVQARAEFSRIVWGMDHGTLTKDEIIERLERLRLAWHGDGLELQVLTLLGDLYNDKKDYVNAMRIWDGGVNSFPGTGTAIEMSRRMEETFILMFNEGTADKLSTIDALALYYQYRNFAPAGTTGREMIDRLADRLIAVDLLEQAATLLEHQMHFQTEKEQRSQIGAKVATIHMLNHQPKKALEALEDSVYGENAILVRLLRNRLAAQALAELGQSDKALQILGQDDTPDAERIRLGIYWQKKDWPKIITSVEAMLRARKDVTAPITLDESEYVLELALAYVFQNDKVQLQYMHDYFGPLMANNPNKTVFDFITASDITLTPTNFDEVIKNLSETRSFIENYRARIQTSGLDAIMHPDEKK